MPTTEERRKSTTDAHKNHSKKDERRKSTVTKLWNWISAKKDESHSKDDSDIKHKKHRAVKKTHRSYTAAVDGHYDYSDDSDSDIHRNPPALRRHVSAQPTAPLTPPESPDLSYEEGEEDSSPSQPKALEAANEEALIEHKVTNVEHKSKPKPPSRGSHGSKSRSSGSGARPKQHQQALAKPRGSPKTDSSNRRRRKRRNRATGNMNANAPLEYPCTPELILDHHKRKEFLTQNEEWLVVELNEYECLIESIDMIHMMAKFSKMFEMDPPEFLEEFFEFVDEVPSYDEVINTDVWQEFRDVKYPY